MAEEASKRSLIDHFSALKDPRQAWKVIYPLPEILLLVLCATLAGAEDFVEARLWGVKNLDFLRRFLPFLEGIPSHDTLNDVVNALDPALFKTCFVAWVEALRDAEPDIVAIDGKTSRRTHDRRKGREPLHLVSAWAARQRLVLGQEATETPSRMRSPPSRCRSSAWPSPEPSSRLMPWAARPRSPTPSRLRARTT